MLSILPCSFKSLLCSAFLLPACYCYIYLFLYLFIYFILSFLTGFPFLLEQRQQIQTCELKCNGSRKRWYMTLLLESKWMSICNNALIILPFLTDENLFIWFCEWQIEIKWIFSRRQKYRSGETLWFQSPVTYFVTKCHLKKNLSSSIIKLTGYFWLLFFTHSSKKLVRNFLLWWNPNLSKRNSYVFFVLTILWGGFFWSFSGSSALVFISSVYL